MADRILVFDVDGVLVDVTESYRETIQRTIEHFSGKRITREEIQDYKNAGGWNNDWMLCHHVIQKEGVAVEYQTVVDYFNLLFLGKDHDGLVYRERWVDKTGVLAELSRTWQFAIFTGRIQEELNVTLNRFGGSLRFDPIMSSDILSMQKPDPEGLLRIAEMNPGKQLWYVGDTVDDARSARAAGVPFIGIASPDSPRRDDLVRLLQSEGAKAVLEDINQLRTVLPQ